MSVPASLEHNIVYREKLAQVQVGYNILFLGPRLIIGVLEIISGFRGGGIGSFVLGVTNLLVGLLLLSSPVTAALAIPIVFGVLLLIQGAGLIFLAFRLRR
jgi:uncharacterized membrane protein HdeD (DUF308 family)